MEEYVYYNNLYDYYYELLTDKQKLYFEEYYFNNLSLAEIATKNSVSRNAVFKQIQITIDKLKEYEDKLNLYKNRQRIEKLLTKINNKKIEDEIRKLI